MYLEAIHSVDLLRATSAEVGNTKRVFFNFNKLPRWGFCDETGVENITLATFKFSLCGASSSDKDRTFSTPFNGDLALRFFGVLLPMSMISISCVKPVLADERSWNEPSSMRLIRPRFRLAPLQKQMWKTGEKTMLKNILFAYCRQLGRLKHLCNGAAVTPSPSDAVWQLLFLLQQLLRSIELFVLE